MVFALEVKELETGDCFANQGDELFNGQLLFSFGQKPLLWANSISGAI
jgi:hypothetical protein